SYSASLTPPLLLSVLCSFPATAATAIYTLSLHDALPILNFSLGNKGVKCSKETRSLTTFGSCPFILLTFIKGKYFSPSFGGRTCPKTVSPVFRPNKRICDCDT